MSEPCRHETNDTGYFTWSDNGINSAHAGALIYINCPRYLLKYGFKELRVWLENPTAGPLLASGPEKKLWVWVLWPRSGCEL